VRILVGYDGSDGARRALDRAVELAAPKRGLITVLAVAELPLDPGGPRNFGTLGDIGAWEGRPLDAPPDVVEHLAEARDRLQGQPHVRAELAWSAGEPARSIVDTASDIHADVIVLGEHHHSLLGRFFGTDTADQVQREAGREVVLA
jgi:nucleotide-binding universal stress UspA family protein